MPWIKRNLFFLVGAAIAVVLLGLAGFYCYSQWSLNNASLEKLDAAYADWQHISEMNPNPGNDKVNNIQLAREQRTNVLQIIQKVNQFFVTNAPIPNPTSGVVVKEEFASALRRTVDQLQGAATAGGITIPAKYDFSFQAERFLPNFAAGSLAPLAAQLGDIKLICTILFQAKINALDSIRRERISADDQNGPQSDYLELGFSSVTNDLAVLVPYEVTFRCFSTELGAVLSAFGSDKHGIIVKAINVEPSTGGTATGAENGPYGATESAPDAAASFQSAYASRYGLSPRRAPVAAPTTASAGRNGLQTVLDEKPLKVTLILNVVRLLPKK